MSDGQVNNLAKATLKATVLLRAFWLGDDRELRVKENPNWKQPNPGTLVRSIGKVLGSIFTLKVQSHNNTVGYTPGNSDLVVCLRVKTFDSWCRDGNLFLQITGCDGSMVQFMPACGDDDDDAGRSGESDASLVELEFMRWKAALSVASSKSVLDERRWFLRGNTLPKPWEPVPLSSGGFGGKIYRAKMNGVTPVAVKHINVSEHADSPRVRVDQEKYIQFLSETLIAITTQGE